METKRRSFGWQRRLWAIALAAVLVCIPMIGNARAATFDSTGGVALLDAAAPKPTVTIQGNVVVDKNKPTGFYELALCVKTARVITDTTTNQTVTEEEYAAALEEAEKNGTPESLNRYSIKNYPFQSAAAAMYINLDALTAVSWGGGKPIYESWTAASGSAVAGSYAGNFNDYPRGINLKNPDQPNIFTDLDEIINGTGRSVRLDTANPDEMTHVAAYIESYNKDTKTALLTFTVNTSTTANVVYDQSTPVVVVRFAYDLNRFRNTDVTANPDFWVGLDKNSTTNGPTNKAPLTYLAEGTHTTGSDVYAVSDKAVNESSVNQSIWYAQNMIDDNVGQSTTRFYYYLGAETPATDGTQSSMVLDGTTVKTNVSFIMPKTAGKAVLAKKSADYATKDDPETGEYSFFQNLLTLKENTLRLELVNAETYRKSTGTGGTTILFYDWDDSLIGSLVVGNGDVRAEVEQYIEENLVHPDLRPDAALKKMGGRLPDDYDYSDPNAKDYQNLTNSLARDYTYRGKYPYTVGGTNDQIRDNGEDYPLTNKLDYVFTKRVNTAAAQTVTQANGASVTETYVLPHKLTEQGMEDAALYPYVYGWAVVEDLSAKNQNGWKLMYDSARLEDTWTTIGVGELSSVTPAYYDNASATVKGIPVTGTGSTVFTAPQFLVDADEGWVDGTQGQPDTSYTDKYAYQLSSTGAEGYFRFADFSNIDAELARYTKASGESKDTLMVKAVYEPGESLIEGSYRMYHEPVYNKWNRFSAAMGGAYSVEIVMERAATTRGPVQGVTRVRQPAVRQDTTADEKWVKEEVLGVNHNLSNATIDTAKKMTETTYTKVDIDNGERIQFTLSLSARQNKVDYYIMEQYGYNFVSGGQRTVTNFDQVGTAFVVDNYNYFVEGDSDESDIYFDVKNYEDREGSHGFVLYGTLNNLMEYATAYSRGEITLQVKNQYITYLNMQDANLRLDAEGTVITDLKESTIQDKIVAAAAACESYHYGEPDFWNNELDRADLTYHQLQWYIINGTLLDRATADKQLLAFCHLHAKCAELSSNKPRSWTELIEAAQGDTSGIGQLTLSEVENLTHLRATTTGGQFANVATFQAKFVEAVTNGHTDWVGIQQYILGTGDVDDYWWFDGAMTNAAPGTLTALGERAQYALHGHTYPDGVERTTYAKLESARNTFNQNTTADSSTEKATKVAAAWVNMTNNLVKAHHEDVQGEGEDEETIYTHDKFANFEEFRDAYLAALRKAEAEGYGYGSGQTAPSWEGIQRMILDGDVSYDNNPDSAAYADFWWKDGNTPLKVTNIKTLLQALQYAQSEDEGERTMGQDALKKVTLELLKGAPFYLRSTIKGEALDADAEYGYDDIVPLLEDIKMAQAAGATEWNSVQYYLIHGPMDALPPTADINKEAAYYWWKDGGEGLEITLSGLGNLNLVITRLQTAALRVSVFGDPKSRASVEAQLKDGSFYELTRLTPTDPNAMSPPAETVDAMEWYKDTDTLLKMISDMNAFMRQSKGGDPNDIYTLPSVDWYVVQYWILTDKYLTGESSSTQSQIIEDYWWYNQTEKPKPPEPPAEEPSAFLNAILQANMGGSITLTQDQFDATGFVGNKAQDGKSVSLSVVNKIMSLLAQEATLSSYIEGGELKLTWVQIQYYIATAHSANAKGTKAGTLVDHDTALQGLIGMGWDTGKFPAGVKT